MVNALALYHKDHRFKTRQHVFFFFLLNRQAKNERHLLGPMIEVNEFGLFWRLFLHSIELTNILFEMNFCVYVFLLVTFTKK